MAPPTAISSSEPVNDHKYFTNGYTKTANDEPMSHCQDEPVNIHHAISSRTGTSINEYLTTEEPVEGFSKTNGDLNIATNGDHVSSHCKVNGHANAATNGVTNESNSTANGDHNDLNAANASKPPPKPIAICGMACRLPGGINTPKHLWEFLLAGGDARSKVPESRYNIEAFYDPSGKPGTTKTQHGYFLDEDVGQLDTSFYSFPRTEVERMDPQQRLMLEVTRECFEDGGEIGWRGKKIGCYVGNLGDDWLEMLAQDTQNFGIYRISGFGDFSLSNRISYEMNLQGPSMTIRTACSASMAALHEACVAIDRGDCVSAIVGGTNLILRPLGTTLMSEQGVLSPDGSCKTFSAAANGYARGEAIVGVFLKPLEDALRDGNSIRAVIRATATNHGGKSAGFAVPSADAQEAMMRRAYDIAGLDVSDTGYVECHGTGTPVGDPIETEAVARVFGKSGVTIGSTKPNFGHTEGASGILSVLKTVLALENKTIPPSIKYLPMNPNIPWKSGRLTLAEEPLRWPVGRLERASVNSFGLGGTNVHAIIDSATNYKISPEADPKEPTAQLLLYSANTQQSLTQLIENYRILLEERSSNVDDIAYTLARGREHLPYRAFVIANGSSVGFASPIIKPSQQKPKIAMVFTGQGAQWPQMCGDLLRSNTVFRSSIRSLDRYLINTLGVEAPSWSIEEELLKPGKKSRINLAEFAQPLCTAIQIALVDTLRSVGIEADAVVGHSSGEIAGAYTTGALTAGEAIVAALYRGVIVKKQERPGAMAALGMGVTDSTKFLVHSTSIACDNSPRSVTISGDADKIEEVLTAIRAARPDILARKLQVDKAYHSHHMTEIGEDYNSVIEQKITEKSPNKLFFSSVENKLLDNNATLGSRYWQKNLESPVQFNGAVTSLLRHFSDQDVILLEIGPHSALAGPLTQIMSETPNMAKYIPTIVRNQNSTENFLAAIGKLFTYHVPLNVKALFPNGSCLSDLPRYPFNYGESSYWFESRLSKEYRQRKYPHHDILGSKLIESTDIEPTWRNLLHVGYNNTWLKDHKVGNDIVFPFAGYVAMAGEAVRQVTRIDDAYCVRRISVGNALLISEDKPTEIITTLRPLRLTVTEDSNWYEFTVTAYNGHQWTKHCSGEVRAEGRALRNGTSPKPFPRSIKRETWFNCVRREGLDLGPGFQNVHDITASTTTNEARGTVTSKKYPMNLLSKYHVHPAVLDSALQLGLVAFSNGLTRKHRNFLPIFCDQLLVVSTSEDFVVNVDVSQMGNGSTSARISDGQGVVAGTVVLKVDGLKMTPAGIIDDSADAPDPHAAARLTWAADFDFIATKDLFQTSPYRQQYAQALEELNDISILMIQKKIININPQRPHLAKYARWIDKQAKLYESPLMDDENLSRTFERVCATFADGPASPVGEALNAITRNIDALFTGSVFSWESLLPPSTLTRFYNFVSHFESSAFFSTLGHSKPNLRILEIGNWTRSPSTIALQSLTLKDGGTLWSKYTFASKNMVATEERLTDYLNLEYVTLDIGEDPNEQGFKGSQYDLVVVSNSLYAMPDLQKALKNIKNLLTPTGYLFLQELSPASRWINTILGTTPAWWRGLDEDRADEPYLDAARWQRELKAAGFGDPDAVVFDSEVNSQINTVIIARPYETAPIEISKPVSLLVKEKVKTYEVIEKVLQEQGYEVTKITLKDVPRPNIDIMSIIDLDGPFFENITDELYADFQKFLANMKNSGIFWVTKPCHIRVQDPRYAQVIGLARVIRSELLIDFATCEMNDVETAFSHVGQAFGKFRKRLSGDTLNPDFEYAIENSVVKIGRYFPFALRDAFIQDIEGKRMKVVIDTPGRLNTLHWVRQPEPAPLEDYGLEIEMHAVGLNFKDVLVGMNLVGQVGRYHGLEGAGIIRRVGPKVKDFKEGDRVVSLEHNMLSTLLITNEILCIKIPDTLSFMEAATMFAAYGTVQQALITIGQLKKGQSLLIHSACGGVGLAAIQIAQMIGAVIYATVGSEEKAQYLVKEWGIPRNRIFNSRDNSFVEGVFRETNGTGIDQVLNSLNGELLHESWKCVAPYGKLVEIGRRELIGHGRLDMEPFSANRSYCAVDISAPDFTFRYKAMMTETLSYFEKGFIKPLVIAREFDASSVAEAFKYLLPGTHIGRVGIRIRDIEGQPTPMNEITNPPQELQLDPEGSYLLVGGLGGLGRVISTYMVEHGARNFVYLGRRAGQSDGDQAFIGELQSMGAHVVTVSGDINELEDVARAVAEAQAPLKGVLQLATAQADENFTKMTKSQWDSSLGPKVNGTWNLHHATAGIKLDFFLLSSSLSSVIGVPGQANYASGNTFLDAFVQYRNNHGLACSSIDIGPIANVGILSNVNDNNQAAGFTGYKMLQEQEVLDAIALSMMSKIPGDTKPTSTFFDPNLFVLGLESTTPLNSSTNRAVWRKDRRMAIYHNDGGSIVTPATSSNQLETYIANARSDPAVLKTPEAANYFAREIGKRLLALLLKDEMEINTRLALADLGLDSLVAIELRAWWKQAFGFDISVLEMLSIGNLERLGGHVSEMLLQIIADDNKE